MAMPSVNLQTGSIRLRMNVDLTEIRRRLRSEYGSAGQPEAEISENIRNCDKDLADCDSEIRRLQSHIIFLQNQQQNLEDYKACLCSLRSPIRRLPNEIILRIFDLACGMNELTSKKLQTMPALAISGVCAHWRDLARSSPDLWSRIRLEMWATPHHLPGLPILNLYLESSQQSPLVMEFPVPPTGSAALEADQLSVCATLGAYSHRWKSLYSPGNKVYDALMAPGHTHFPLLEELVLPHIIFYDETTLNRFQLASKLKFLSLGRIDNWVDLQQHQKFPWAQLTVLDVAQCSHKMGPIFERSSKLKELCFRQFTDGAIRLCSPPISAPFVEKLTLFLQQKPTPESERLANVIFASLTCPHLTSLFIEAAPNYKHEWPRNVMNGFISRSSFQLTTLSIKFVPLVDSDLIDLLYQLPSLLHLVVNDSDVDGPSPITTQLMQRLHAFHRTSDMTIPSTLAESLQSLTLTFSKEGPFNDKEFVDMVSSRWFPDIYAGKYGLSVSNFGTACLRSVVMRFTKRDVDEEVYRKLTYLEREGMRVVVAGRGSFPP